MTNPDNLRQFDGPQAKPATKTLRKRRCRSCKEIFYSFDATAHTCQNCDGSHDSGEQSAKDQEIVRQVNSKVETDTPQVSATPTQPAKQKGKAEPEQAAPEQSDGEPSAPEQTAEDGENTQKSAKQKGK